MENINHNKCKFKTLDKSVHIRMDDSMFERLKEISKNAAFPVAEVIRIAIWQMCDDIKNNGDRIMIDE